MSRATKTAAPKQCTCSTYPSCPHGPKTPIQSGVYGGSNPNPVSLDDEDQT